MSGNSVPNRAAMTATEMLPAIGAQVLVRCGALNVLCRVLDVKQSWGRPRLYVSPERGNGGMWVELGRVCQNGGSAAVSAALAERAS